MVLPARAFVAALALLAWGGCSVAELPPRSDGSAAADGGGEAAGAEAGWWVARDALPGSLLSVCGAGDERWAVGADAGAGPLVLHRAGGTWSALATGTRGHLWWVACMGDGGVVMVGEGGVIVRKRAGEEDLEALSVGMNLPLYGAWGASVDDFYVVGGATDARNGPGVAFRVKGSAVAAVPGLPAALSPTAAFFKVWGSGPDDVWIVGEGGTVLHGGDSGWSLELLPQAARLVTVHGAGGLVMAVGGAAGGLVFEHSEGAWAPVDLGEVGIIQGVHVAAGGRAVIAGLSDLVFARRAGVYSSMGPTPVGLDWHGVWIGAEGDVWLAGGSAFQLTKPASGALVCFGTAATCGGGGGGGGSAVVEPVADAGADSAGDSGSAGDGGAESDGDAVTDAPVDADAGSGQVSTGDFPLQVARFDDFGAAVALATGTPMKVHFGPQGGTHLEVGGIFEASGLGATPRVVVSGSITLGGEQVGSAPPMNWTTDAGGPTYALTYYVQVAFSGVWSDAPPIDSTATLCLSVTLTDQRNATACVDVFLSAD